MKLYIILLCLGVAVLPTFTTGEALRIRRAKDSASSEESSKEGLCVFTTYKKIKLFCSLCSVDKTDVRIKKIFPNNDRCSGRTTCKYPNPEEVPVTPTQVDVSQHVCGKKGGYFAWYCSYCSVEKNGASFRTGLACKRNGARTDTLCVGLPTSTAPPVPPTTEAPPVSARTVFPPLQHLCVADSRDAYPNCPCPTDRKPPQMDFALPDIVTRHCKTNP